MAEAKEPYCELRVRVTPRSSKNKLVIQSDGSVKAWVTAAPTDGQANDAVIELVSQSVGIAKSRVGIVRGLSGREKLLRIQNLNFEELTARLKNSPPR